MEEMPAGEPHPKVSIIRVIGWIIRVIRGDLPWRMAVTRSPYCRSNHTSALTFEVIIRMRLSGLSQVCILSGFSGLSKVIY